jgi:RNA polymerase sigma-70 factor, ECF subfamily
VTMQPRQPADDWERMLREQARLHGRQFFRVAFGILRDTHAAEDACQHVLMKAWELRERIRDPVALQAWLLRVIVTESLQMVRRRKSELHAYGEYVPDSGAQMSEADRAEFRELFHAALADLPEQTQVVVVLRLIDGMTGNEVKNLLACSASEVSRRLHHGMEYLRERMARTYLGCDKDTRHAM